jgi:hypothetical protein
MKEGEKVEICSVGHERFSAGDQCYKYNSRPGEDN